MNSLKKIVYHSVAYIYSSLFIAHIPIIYLKKFRRSLNYRKRWAERFAHIPLRLRDCIWIHSVSVGESLSAEPLMKKLLENNPDERFVVTTTTPTGSDVITRLYSSYPNVHHVYMPYDIQPFIKKFFVKVNPKLFIIIETEIWPNVLNECFKENIPVIITNARLSKRSLRNYKKIPFGKEILFSNISHISAQTEKDAKRFCSLGIQKNKIIITGNLKYSMIRPENLNQEMTQLKKNLEGRRIWIAGSTHQGEEEILLQAHKKILKTHPNCLLIIVPRHKERFRKVEKIIINNNFSFQKRSLFKNQIHNYTQVYLGDTMGELLHLYHISEITFVGGTLIENGGHNLLEPAALNKPIISGTSLYNFSQISKELIRNKALKRVKNANELSKGILFLFNSPKELKQMAENSYKTFQSHNNVLEQQYIEIIKFL